MSNVIRPPQFARGPAIRPINEIDEASELKAASELLKIAAARPEKREEIMERVMDALAGFKGAML